jgi:nucleotide-binding universal stress UspA family protein
MTTTGQPSPGTAAASGSPELVALVPEASTVGLSLSALVLLAHALPNPRLTAIHITADPDRAAVSAEEADLQQLRALREGSAEERAARTYEAFSSWRDGAGPDGSAVSWRSLAGPQEDVAAPAIAQASAVVIARPHSLDGSDALHAALFSHRLVLFVPDEWDRSSLGRHIAIGWRPGRTLDQALAGARPWLLAAETLTLLVVDHAPFARPEKQLPHSLRTAPVRAEFRFGAARGRSVGLALLDMASEAGADCLLIGAYRQGQLLETFIGGATRDILKATRIPVFLAH